MKYIIPATIAISVGVLILLGYFINAPIFLAMRILLTDWAIILGALALVVGVINLVLINIRRTQSPVKGRGYNILTALAVLTTFLIGIIEGQAGFLNEGSLTNIVLDGIVLSSQAALFSLALILLITSALRFMEKNNTPWAILFLASALIVLIGWLPFGFLSPVNALRDWFIQTPVAAGARGILIGVALGTLLVGIRVLTGVERPYKD